MNNRFLNIQTPDGSCDAFVSYPSEPGSYPGIILYMDAFGLRAYLQEMAQTLAERGYFVLVPNLFYRAGRAPIIDVKFPLTMEERTAYIPKIMPLIKGYSTEFATTDTVAFMQFLQSQKEVRKGKIGTTGYCMGGRLSIGAAGRFPDRVAAAASFHAGGLATDAPDSPHSQLKSVTAELYIAHADQDTSMPPEQIERLRQALDDAGVKYEAEVYQGAAHGFMMADLPQFNEAAAKRHWEKLLALFDRAFNVDLKP